MRILVLNWQDWENPKSGGAEVHLKEVFSRIARSNDVTLFCSSFPHAAPDATLSGIHVIRRGGRYLFNIRVFFAYRKTFRGKFDIVIDDWNKIPFFTPLYVKEPLMGIVHHLFDKSIFTETNWLLATYVYVMERIALKIYRDVPFIVGSKSTHDELLKHGFTEITQINYGVDHDLYRPSVEKPVVEEGFVPLFTRFWIAPDVDCRPTKAQLKSLERTAMIQVLCHLGIITLIVGIVLIIIHFS